MLQVRQLKKSYGDRPAVAEVSFDVRAGELLGLLGPNGAGKSTTVGMIAGLVTPDAGVATIDGTSLAQDPSAYKRRIGLVPQDLALVEEMTAIDNVRLFGALYGLPRARLEARAAEVLATVGLADRAKDRPSTFSGGMKRRLNIACALVHDPEVLLLDEPTAGVDPQSRNAIFDNLETLKRAGKALVYTTHAMAEVERLADRIVIVDHGRVVADGTLDTLLRTLPAAQTLLLDTDGTAPAGLLDGLAGVRSVRIDAGRLAVGLDDLGRTAPAVLAALAAHGIAVRHLGSDRATLEDVFLALTGRALRD